MKPEPFSEKWEHWFRINSETLDALKEGRPAVFSPEEQLVIREAALLVVGYPGWTRRQKQRAAKQSLALGAHKAKADGLSGYIDKVAERRNVDRSTVMKAMREYPDEYFRRLFPLTWSSR